MDYTYSLPATQCPAPQVPSALYEILADPPTPTVYTAIIGGAAGGQTLRSRLNRNSRRGELQARYGGGGYGIAWGLTLDDGGGLTLDVSAGHALLDGACGPEDDTTLALSDSVVNYVWLSQGGTLSKVTSASATPLAPPSSAVPWAYLGAVTCGGGTIRGIDGSGVVYLRSNGLWRTTGDTAAPADEPDARCIGLHTITAEDELYLWDGSAHRLIDASTAAVTAEQAALEFELEQTNRLLRRLVLNLARGPLGSSVLDPMLQPSFRQALAEA